MERKESSGQGVKNFGNNREDLGLAAPGCVSGDWSRLRPGCEGSLFLPAPLSWPVSKGAHPELSPGAGVGEVGDWPEEACSGVGHRGFPPGPTLFRGQALLDSGIPPAPFPSSK